ncbi:MAG: carbohydrate-binding protein, partial [Opitutaceae bacterium]|nr:carbohydrate-binding protein [Verrucomicrobiales bacterium]
TSPNGITNWTFRGLAYDPRVDFVRYTDGTVNRWDKLERPGVVIENGHVTHITLAVLDVPKNEERGNDMHGSKVIVIPFDGAALDRDLQILAKTPSPSQAPPQPK